MNESQPGSGPIFVGGLDRTGTSLIYALLASHPRIAMTRRTNWWSYFHGRYGDLDDDHNLDRLLGAMSRYRRHRKLRPDFADLRASFVVGPRTYGRLFELLESQHAARVGRARWGDKSLHTERYATTVFDTFPEARIIHMIRDPRDRYASVLKRWKSVRGGIGAATAAWLASVDLGERNVRRFPGRYMLLRYEDLASDPESSLRRVSEFIGEAYDTSMLKMDGAEDFRSTGGNSSYGAFEAGTISKRSIGRFRATLTPADIAFVQSRAGRAMRAHGYDGVPVVMTGGERIRYAVRDRPLNAAKLLGWQIRERIYDVLGRSPGAHTIEHEEDAAADSADAAQDSNE
jgi:hypothetical protein